MMRKESTSKRNGQRGASLVEYTLLLGGIAIITISVLTNFGYKIKVGKMSQLSCELAGIPKADGVTCNPTCFNLFFTNGYSLDEARAASIAYCSS